MSANTKKQPLPVVTWTEGDLVLHEIHGDGVILDVFDAHAHVAVRFFGGVLKTCHSNDLHRR